MAAHLPRNSLSRFRAKWGFYTSGCAYARGRRTAEPTVTTSRWFWSDCYRKATTHGTRSSSAGAVAPDLKDPGQAHEGPRVGGELRLFGEQFRQLGRRGQPLCDDSVGNPLEGQDGHGLGLTLKRHWLNNTHA
jgi:hypothetical protein